MTIERAALAAADECLWTVGLLLWRATPTLPVGFVFWGIGTVVLCVGNRPFDASFALWVFIGWATPMAIIELVRFAARCVARAEGSSGGGGSGTVTVTASPPTRFLHRWSHSLPGDRFIPVFVAGSTENPTFAPDGMPACGNVFRGGQFFPAIRLPNESVLVASEVPSVRVRCQACGKEFAVPDGPMGAFAPAVCSIACMLSAGEKKDERA